MPRNDYLMNTETKLINTIVVATMPGTLPMGGWVPDTPIHALAPAPKELALQDKPGLLPKRNDIDLDGPLAFVIDDVIAADEADALIEITEQIGYRSEAPGIQTAPGLRINKTVHWLSDENLLGVIFRRIQHLLPQVLDGDPLYPGFSHRINMYKYDHNDVFRRHIDGDWPGYGLSDDGQSMVEWRGLRSKLSMLLYLNGPKDGVQGGYTKLFRPDSNVIEVVPKKGSALFFRHGFGPHSVSHEGATVRGDIPKYVARINVLYANGEESQ